MIGMEMFSSGALLALVLLVGARGVAQESANDGAPPREVERVQDDGAPTAAQTAAAVVEPPAAEAATETREAPSSLGPRYHFLEDRDGLLSAWRGSGLVEALELGVSAGGRELFGVQFGGPGPIPLDERTTILLLGGLDGVSLAGSEAVIAITEALLANADALPASATFVAVPWANPDGLARWRAQGCTDGRNDRQSDDDRDGRVDEDQPDDLDGDGVVLEMLIEDVAGAWVRDEDARFLRRAREGEAPRYTRVREGKDDDGDGLFNEDPVGGVILDRNFPVHWAGSWTGELSGPWPLSEPAARAIADFARARRTALAFVFQGNHGRLATPGGVPTAAGILELPFASDRPAYQALADAFRRHTSRPNTKLATLYEVGGAPRPGAAVDWLYAALGALSLEIGVWGPDIEAPLASKTEKAGVRPQEGGFGARGSGDEPASADRAWARWLDDSLGGLGFVDWQPVDLGDGRSALVGGWEPYTCSNPPAAMLPLAVRGLDDFVLDVARSLPRLELEIVENARDGRIAMLRARVRNTGVLPTGAGPDGGRFEAKLRLELPPGVQLLAGDETVELGHLPGLGTSATYDWLLVAPTDSIFHIIVESGWSPPIQRELRL